MSITAAHFKELTNGYEKRTDGLWVHKGRADVGGLRVTNALSPPSGAGLELGFYPTPPASANAYILAIDRDAGVQRDLAIYGKNITLTPSGGGSVSFPAGTTQQLIGSYLNVPTFSATTVGAWLVTPVSTGSIACTGAQCRIEASTCLAHSAAAASFYTGYMLDGVVQYALSFTSGGTAGAVTAISWQIYITPTAANHTFALCVYNNLAGTLSINANANSTLYVTEQRR